MTDELRQRIETSWNEAKACTPAPKEASVREILADADSMLSETCAMLNRICDSIRADAAVRDDEGLEQPKDMTGAASALAAKAFRLRAVAERIAVALGV